MPILQAPSRIQYELESAKSDCIMAWSASPAHIDISAVENCLQRALSAKEQLIPPNPILATGFTSDQSICVEA